MKFEDEKMQISNTNKTVKYKYIKSIDLKRRDMEDILFFILICICSLIFYININDTYKLDKNIFRILKKEELNYKEDKNILIFNTINTTLKEKYEKEILFLQSCANETKIDSYKDVNDPILSFIIPIFNQEKSIIRLIRNIQKQNIKKIEIIFVDDNSNDKGIALIEKCSKKDKRIKIIKNKEHKGILYSYDIGILEAKSQHTILFNVEDMLLSELSKLYEESKKNEKDINSFGYINGHNYIIENEIRLVKKVLYQPSINDIFFTYNYSATFINNKIYKTKMLQKAVKSLKKELLNSALQYHGDTILFFCIFSYASSYKSHKNFFIQYHENPYIVKANQNYNDLFKSTMYLFQYIISLKFLNNKYYNMHVAFGITAFNLPLGICANNKLLVDWKQINDVMNKTLNIKRLNKDNKLKIEDLLNEIKAKNNNNY